MGTRKETGNTTVRLVVAALFMAMVIGLSSFGITVPGGHLYLCDVVICLAAILLNPVEAMVVGGIGAFLGDFFFYQPPMFVSLVVHGVQALVISLIAHKTLTNRPRLASGIGVGVGVVIMVVGYTLGKGLVYSTWEYAYIKLPYEIAQGLLGAVVGMVLCWNLGVGKMFNKLVGTPISTPSHT